MYYISIKCNFYYNAAMVFIINYTVPILDTVIKSNNIPQPSVILTFTLCDL